MKTRLDTPAQSEEALKYLYEICSNPYNSSILEGPSNPKGCSRVYYKPNNPIENSIPESPSNTKQVGGPLFLMAAPCVNEGFENTPSGSYVGATNSLAVQGWTLWSATVSSCGTPNWQPGATEFSVFTTPIINFPLGGCGSGNTMNIGNSPLGGTQVVQMNNCIKVIVV